MVTRSVLPFVLSLYGGVVISHNVNLVDAATAEAATAATTVVSQSSSLQDKDTAGLIRNENETEVVHQKKKERQLLDRVFAEDICKHPSRENEYGPCNWDFFPQCDDDEVLCFNRKPFRDRFYDDNRQPHFYIDYSLVFCYPLEWNDCSSCTPGRYCLSENRCILDEIGYDCERWL